ncbi:MAG: hypothetical protein C0433_07990 [Cyclobacterium sp.]|nr:hypothetical protein [Cyclobacterium sp.]
MLVRGQDNNGLVPLYRFNIETRDTTFLFSLKSSLHRQSWGAEENPILSADGKNIFYIEKNRNTSTSKVFSYDLATGAIESIVTFDSPDITSFSASPDGKYLSAIVLYQGQAGRPSAIRIVSLSGGETHDLFKERWGDATKFFGLGWSPDSRYIYYIRMNAETESNSVWRVDILEGQPQNTGISMTDIRMPNIHPNGKHLVFYGGDGWYRTTYEVRAIKITSNPD